MNQIQKLLELVSRHIGCYQELVQLLRLEQKSLIALDHDRLLELAAEKKATIMKIHEHTNLIAPRLKQVAQRYGFSLDPLPTLAQLAEAAPGPWSGELRRAGHALARLKKEVSAQNDDNRNYIHDALGLIESTLAILTGQSGTGGKYLHTGQLARRQDRGPLKLNREV